MISRVSTGFEVMDKDLGTRAEIHAVIEERIGERKISGEKKKKHEKEVFKNIHSPNKDLILCHLNIRVKKNLKKR